MAPVLTIRNLSEDVLAALREGVAAAGRSVEAEAREILVSACISRRSDEWWRGLSSRRNARTPKRLELESAQLIREARDAR
jgi:plasmid stability protein